jgi:hypothetical protein
MRNIAAVITTRYGGNVTGADVDRVVRGAPELRSHPLLSRGRYLTDVTATPVPQIPQSSAEFGSTDSSVSSAFANAWRSLTRVVSGGNEYTSLVDMGDDYEDPYKRQQRVATKEESARVRSEVRLALDTALANGDWRKFSSEIDCDFYMCVSAKYSTAVLRIVPDELKLEYPRAVASARRPYLESWSSYNLGRATSVGRKHVVCTMFRFRYPSMPEYAPPLAQAVSSSSSSQEPMVPIVQ